MAQQIVCKELLEHDYLPSGIAQNMSPISIEKTRIKKLIHPSYSQFIFTSEDPYGQGYFQLERNSFGRFQLFHLSEKYYFFVWYRSAPSDAAR